MSSPSYIFERDAELFLRYHEALKNDPTLTHQEAIRKAVKSPTSRYWVSFYEVYREILNIVHGREFSKKMKPSRRKQIEDIYERYRELAAKPTFKDSSVYFIVQFAIAEPAPEFYLGYDRAQTIIQRIKRDYDIEELG